MTGHLVRSYLDKLKEDSGESLAISPREKEILNLLAKGYSSKEIADQLFISPSTVHTHRSNLMAKLGLKNRRELTQFARDHGLIQDL
jgi:DNA-binding NarL/FixJ family response regulator